HHRRPRTPPHRGTRGIERDRRGVQAGVAQLRRPGSGLHTGARNRDPSRRARDGRLGQRDALAEGAAVTPGGSPILITAGRRRRPTRRRESVAAPQHTALPVVHAPRIIVALLRAFRPPRSRLTCCPKLAARAAIALWTIQSYRQHGGADGAVGRP